VYDASEADYNAFVDLVIAGPISDPQLPPDAIVPFGAEQKQAALRMLPGLEGAFHRFAVEAIAGLGSLDRVGLGVYEGLLRKVPGVRIGRVIDGSVAWEPAE
jgi:hypothetical protein